MIKIEKFMKLASCMDLRVWKCLLLIRQASKAYRPPYLQLTINDFLEDNDIGKELHETPWDIIVNATISNPEGYVIAITYAMKMITPHLTIIDMLIDELQTIKIDKLNFREIVDFLSNVSLDDSSLSMLYEFALSKELLATSYLKGDFYTPRSIVDFMLKMFNIKNQGSIYDPCCGSAALLCRAANLYPDKKLGLFGQTLDNTSYQICLMNLFLHGFFADLGDRPANTLLEDLHEKQKFDYIITNPPFNQRDWFDERDITGADKWIYGLPPVKNANFAWIQHVISHLTNNGSAAIILPNSTLTTQNRKEDKIRQKILYDQLIECIITLPAGLFYNTKIPCCIWFINKVSKRSRDVLLIDATKLKLKQNNDIEFKKLMEVIQEYRMGILQKITEFYAIVSLEKIEQNRYNLSPNLYTKRKSISLLSIQKNKLQFETSVDTLCPLISDSLLCTCIREWKTTKVSTNWKKAFIPELYDIFGGILKRKESFGHGTPMVDVKTVLRHLFLPDLLSSFVEVSKEEAEKYSIKLGDILLNRTSETIGELACCSVSTKDYNAVYGNYVKRLRPWNRSLVDSFYMAGYFRSIIYRQEVENVSPVYTTYATMNIDRLSSISIYYPELEMQHKIGETLFNLSNFQERNCNSELNAKIGEFLQLLIEQFITYPVLLLQKKEN
jgi:type I restriction enzyme M protein